MAASPLDFTPAPAARPRGRFFAPLQEAREATRDPLTTTLIFILFGALIAAIVFHVRMRRRLQRRHREARWKRVREVCVERSLSHDDTETLLRVLHDLDPSEPDRGVTSEAFFHSIVAPELERRIGEARCRYIQVRLFGGEEAEAKADEGIGGTREMEVGQKIRIHFDGAPGTYACTVINNEESGFILTLPPQRAKELQVHKDQAVEGFVHLHKRFFSFQSKVLEVFTTHVVAYRIAHTSRMTETHRRQHTRVSVVTRIPFRHMPAAHMSEDAVDFAALAEQNGEAREGVIGDVSVGGCSIITPARRNFDVGDFVQFDFRLLPDEKAYPTLAQIVHISPLREKEAQGIVLHLQFLGLDEEAQASVARTVHTLARDKEEQD